MNGSSTNDISRPNPSSNEVAPASHSRSTLLASLTGAFSSKFIFTISTQFVDRQNSPELTKIKQKVKAIPEMEFQMLSEIGNHFRDSRLRVEDYQCDLFSKRAFVQNQPEFKQREELIKIFRWVTEEKEKFGAGGEQLIAGHIRLINESILLARDEANKVDLKLRAIYILRDKTEYWEGFWNAIEEQLLPDSSVAAGTPTEPILALALWVAGLIASGLIYHKSWERKKFLEVLSIWENMLTGDHKTILETRNELKEYLKSIQHARGEWLSEVKVIWLTKASEDDQGGPIFQYDAYVKHLEVAQAMLSLRIEPVKEALGQMYPIYGPGISVPRNTKAFCEEVPGASISLRKLLTAEGIIHTSHQGQFREKVYLLARNIYGRLEQIERLCASWSKSIDSGELAVFLEEGSVDFLVKNDRLIQDITRIVESKTSDRKKSHALKKRTEWDRRLRSWNWKDRPLTTSDGPMEVLGDLEDIIKVIHRFSNSLGTGTNMPPMEGLVVAQRSHVEFNHSNPLLEDFFKILREEILQGSIAFPESRETGTTETKTSRSGWWRIGRRKKPEAPISGL